jgi:hypothetical protein
MVEWLTLAAAVVVVPWLLTSFVENYCARRDSHLLVVVKKGSVWLERQRLELRINQILPAKQQKIKIIILDGCQG